MNLSLSLAMIILAFFWTLVLLWCIKTNKISIKYSMVWFFVIVIMLLVGLCPNLFYKVAHFFGFDLLSDFVVGILITLLLMLTLALTIIATTLKTTVRNLVEELSLLKKEVNDIKKGKDKHA